MSGMNEMKAYLIKNNVKPSYPRLKILEYMLRHKNHPTVDDIYSDLIHEMPTLSKTTVYNTLNLFVEANVAVPIHVGGNETRYDATVEQHGHFKCDTCGMIYDFTVTSESTIPPSLEGFEIYHRKVYYTGQCKKCVQKTN